MPVGGMGMINGESQFRPEPPGSFDRIPGPVRTGFGVYKDGVSKSSDIPDGAGSFAFRANLANGARVDTNDSGGEPRGLRLGVFGPGLVGFTERGSNAADPSAAGRGDRTAGPEGFPLPGRKPEPEPGVANNVPIAQTRDEQAADNSRTMIGLAVAAVVGIALVVRN